MYDFPRNVDWKWKPVRRLKPFTLSPRGEETLWDEPGAGWLFWAMFSANSPKLELKLDVYADEVVDVDTTIEQLYNMGFIGVGQGQFLVSRYDDTNNVYVVQYSPHAFGVPFRGRNSFKLLNPTNDTVITVHFFYGWLILLK